MTHLDQITARQRKGLVRDWLFVGLLAISTIVAVSSVREGVVASATVARR